MLEIEKLKRVNFNVEPTKWEDFKIICRFKQSDSNKELRKFIDEYLKQNAELQKILREETKN